MQKISIIGGGIGGLTAAIFLRSKGFDCDVYERTPVFKEVGAAISVWPNALRVFRQLGILDEVLEKCGEVKDAYVKTSAGKILTHSRPAYDLPAVCMHRADLLAILLKQVPAENLHSGYELQDFYQPDDHTVSIRFTNGEETSSNLLIGADGIHSLVRQKVIGDGSPLYRGYNIWRGIAELDFNQGYASETLGSGNRVGIVPIQAGRFGWWATANEPLNQTDEPEGTRNKLKRIFSGWHPPIPQLVDHTPLIIKNSLLDRIPVRGWSKSNAVLIGDAAHPTTPNLGQGACVAIEGAFLLSQCLYKYGFTKRAFSVYEDIHYPRTSDIVKSSLLLGQIGQWQHPVATRFRNLFFSLQSQKASFRILDKYFNYDVTQLSI
ncbi:FAD-dependent monooxygenase [Spirosoma knui]